MCGSENVTVSKWIYCTVNLKFKSICTVLIDIVFAGEMRSKKHTFRFHMAQKFVAELWLRCNIGAKILHTNDLTHIKDLKKKQKRANWVQKRPNIMKELFAFEGYFYAEKSMQFLLPFTKPKFTLSINHKTFHSKKHSLSSTQLAEKFFLIFQWKLYLHY